LGSCYRFSITAPLPDNTWSPRHSNPTFVAMMKNCVWRKPELVTQIEFTEWTPDNHLRHSKFVGLRDDKDAREVVREIEG